MHDLNLNLFYKTSFDVRPNAAGGDALWSILMSIRYWICRKWARTGVNIPEDNAQWTELKKGSRITSQDESASVRIESASIGIGSGAGQWACKITEISSSERIAPRQWVTEVGYAERAQGPARLSIVLSYGDQPGFVGPVNGEPTPTVPGLVRSLSNNGRIECLTSGQTLSLEAKELKTGDFLFFWELVSDHSRDTPVVLVSPSHCEDGSLHLLVNPDLIASLLGPSAMVFFTTDRGFCEEMAYLLPDRNLRCTNGSIRVYAPSPRLDDPDDAKRHRFFYPELIESIGEEQVALFLRRALAQDVGSYETMTRLDTVRAARRRFALEARTREAAAAHAREKVEDAEEQALEWVSEIEAKLDDAIAERNMLADENDSLRSSIFALKSQVASLEMRDVGPQIEIDMSAYPDTPEAVAKMLVSTFPDRLDLTDRGWRSLDNCASAPKLVWDALYSLCTIAYEVYSGEPGASMEEAFRSRSHFDYSPSAGMMTNDNPKLRREYQDCYQGRQVDCGAHIGKGNVDGRAKSIRIYFCFDEETKRVIVSSCGDHLPNYTGQFIK